MRYVAHLLVLMGAGIVGWAALAAPWFITHPLDLPIAGWDLDPGRASAAIAALAIGATLAALVLRRQGLVVSQGVSAGLLFVMAAWAWLGTPAQLGLGADVRLEAATGIVLLQAGACLVAVGALWAFVRPPVAGPLDSVLRLAVLHGGSIIDERSFVEPRDVTLGTDPDATVSLPEAAGFPGREVLLKASRKSGQWTLRLLPRLRGQLQLDGRREEADVCRARHGGASGDTDVLLGGDDWGLLHAGPLAVFVQMSTGEPSKRRGLWQGGLDVRALAAAAVSGLLHLSLILAALFFWQEQGSVDRSQPLWRALQVDATIVELREEEPPDEPEPVADAPLQEENAGQSSDGEAGRFGDPTISPEVPTRVPRVDRPLTRERPTSPNLVDLLSTRQLGGIGAIANVLSRDSDGVSNKLAVAMQGVDDSLALGNGDSGMTFRGTGPGGGGDGTFAVIKPVGRNGPLGDGVGYTANPGRKPTRRVERLVSVGTGTSTTGCRPTDIRSSVRRRSSTFRNCFERRLLVQPGLSGRMVARWTIGLDGKVRGAQIVGGSLKDAALGACLGRAIKRIRFRPPAGAMCVVQWPFVFRPGS